MSKEKIQKSTFPLYFSIIVNDAVNLSKLNLQGYPTMYGFFLGEKLSNYKFDGYFDWRGVNNNLTVQSNAGADFILVRFCDFRFTGGKLTLPTNTRNCP